VVDASPWPLFTALGGLYATMLKLALGRHYKAADEVKAEIAVVRAEVAEMRSDMSYLKGRIREKWGDRD
jgi:hypothetical protein